MRACLTLSLLSVFLSGGRLAPAASRAELRGIWMHATQIKTPVEADALVAKIDRAHLNAVFVLVWYWGGKAFYRSDLCPMGDGVQPGYDPLGYLIEQCHRRDIQVHAWFVNGAYGASRPRHVLDEHPDWVVDDGAGGQLVQEGIHRRGDTCRLRLGAACNPGVRHSLAGSSR